MARADVATLATLTPGSHVCWIVDDDATYVEWASVLLRDAVAANEKAVLFGPEGSRPLVELASLAVQVADPRVAFLGGGSLDAESMFAMFREQTALARAEGYARLRVVADMDWLVPAHPTIDDVVAFELLLDKHVNELDATIVCAYRKGSFDTGALAGARCVHPIDAGSAGPPQFRLVAAGNDEWRLAGEIDIAVADEFAAAFSTAAGSAPCTVDVSALDFIDVVSMRALAKAARASGTPIRLLGAAPPVRRSWELAGFGEVAPTVELVA